MHYQGMRYNNKWKTECHLITFSADQDEDFVPSTKTSKKDVAAIKEGRVSITLSFPEARCLHIANGPEMFFVLNF